MLEDLIQEEIEFAKTIQIKNKTLIDNFITEESYEIIRGEDWQFGFYKNKDLYYSALTSFGALILGIETYLKNNKIIDNE